MMKRYMHGELAPDTPKRPNEPMAIDPNSKVNQSLKSTQLFSEWLKKEITNG
jgi:hypothetical protein